MTAAWARMLRGAGKSEPTARRHASPDHGTDPPANDVVKDYIALANDLIAKWSDYASQVAARLESRAYDADTAAADLLNALSLTTETGVRLAWETLDTIAILAGRLDQRYVLQSDEYTTRLPRASLELAGDLTSGFGYVLPATRIQIIPTELAAGETKFKLQADATDRRAGTYFGNVLAQTPEAEEKISIRIVVP